MMRERTHLEQSLAEIDEIENGLADNLDLLELAEAEAEGDVAQEAEQALRKIKGRAAKA